MQDKRWQALDILGGLHQQISGNMLDEFMLWDQLVLVLYFLIVQI